MTDITHLLIPAIVLTAIVTALWALARHEQRQQWRRAHYDALYEEWKISGARRPFDPTQQRED